MLIVEAVKHIM